MRQRLLVLALLAGLSACQQQPEPPRVGTTDAAGAQEAQTPDARFAAFSTRALDTWMQLSPVTATQTGDHRFDAQIDDLSATGRQRSLDANKKLLTELNAIEVAKLARENQVDAAILRNQLQSEIWNTEVLQSWAWDPQVYNSLAGGALYSLMARELGDLDRI
ncbi:DUF885 family protein, partial [Xanthomonas fragariae]|uniref:DUF885 family protein n=1 Tax=Xanthomonas fragariae TaxID=48664 RepID=UPI00131F0C27